MYLGLHIFVIIFFKIYLEFRGLVLLIWNEESLILELILRLIGDFTRFVPYNWVYQKLHINYFSLLFRFFADLFLSGIINKYKFNIYLDFGY